MPLTANGKLDREALPAGPPERGSAARFVPPRSETERRLAGIWEGVLGIRPVGVTESFFDLGGHSLMAARLMARIGTAFGRELPLATLIEEPTIEALARRLESQASGRPWSPLVPIQPLGARPPLVCVHPGGGSVMGYHALARHLGSDQPVFGLEARGLDDGAEPLTTVEDMAEVYLAAVRGAVPEGPYVLAGHSFGGVVAFEMARRLLADGQRVALLAMIDVWRAPSDFEPSDRDRALFADGFAHDLGVSLDRVHIAWDHFWSLPTGAQIEYALDVALTSRLLPPDVSLAQVRRYLKLHLTSVEAMRRYSPRPIGCPIVLFRAEEELSMTPRDPGLGWAALATGGVDVQTVPGSHFTVLQEPHVLSLARGLRGRLDAAMLDEAPVRPGPRA
jgi:thioesterase domain-containing protein